MAKRVHTIDLAQRIQRLLEEREHHAAAMTQIDLTLGQVGVALQAGPNGVRRGRKPGRPRGPSAVSGGAGGQPVRRRRRRRFAATAEEFVLSIVKARRNPTTQDINSQWKSEGRGATADNTLTKLVKENRLKRTPLGTGIRGSRYAVA